MEAATQVSSFAKSLFLGEIHEELVFPYPSPDDAERRRISALVRSCREFGETYDERAGSPTYCADGRISRPSRFCSRMCAAQPAVRAQLNSGVNSSGGTPA